LLCNHFGSKRIIHVLSIFEKYIDMEKLLIMLMFAFISCTKEDLAVPNISLGSKIEATYDTDVVYKEGVKTKITKIEDSRCPKSVTCVWQGSVKIYLTLFEANVSRDVVLEFLADNSKPAITTVELGSQKYSVEILDVLPYPESTGEIKLKDYKVSMTVKKA
jgi:hypothetical protein